MDNLLSYCGKKKKKIRASDKDLPVIVILDSLDNLEQNCRYQNQVASYILVLGIRDNCWHIYNSFVAPLLPNYCDNYVQ